MEREIVRLPSGEWRRLDRGAEQGDPEGSFKSSAVRAEACRQTSERFAESEGAFLGAEAVDWWYIDDGRLIIRPERADAWLGIFDEELAADTCTLYMPKAAWGRMMTMRPRRRPRRARRRWRGSGVEYTRAGAAR